MMAADPERRVGTDYVPLLTRPLFDGANGVVHKATDPSGTRVLVVKTIKQQPGVLPELYRATVWREYRNIRRCASKHVAECVDIAAAGDLLALVLPFYPGGDLLGCLAKLRLKKRTMPANLRDAVFKQICQGVLFIHRQGVAHRDIKPENCLVDAHGVIKINDFGYLIGLPSDAGLVELLCGTTSFKAPELFAADCSIDFCAVDVWALGIVYFQVFLMLLPWLLAAPDDARYAPYAQHYDAAQVPKLASRLGQREWSTKSNPALAFFKKLHHDARTATLQVLCPDPAKRPTAVQLLEGKWLTLVYANSNDLVDLMA